jgi:hypothetical protein
MASIDRKLQLLAKSKESKLKKRLPKKSTYCYPYFCLRIYQQCHLDLIRI